MAMAMTNRPVHGHGHMFQPHMPPHLGVYPQFQMSYHGQVPYTNLAPFAQPMFFGYPGMNYAQQPHQAFRPAMVPMFTIPNQQQQQNARIPSLLPTQSFPGGWMPMPNFGPPAVQNSIRNPFWLG